MLFQRIWMRGMCLALLVLLLVLGFLSLHFFIHSAIISSNQTLVIARLQYFLFKKKLFLHVVVKFKT